MISGIYKISNILDERKYIGSAKNIKIRWEIHKNDIKKNKHHSPKLQNWCNKYSINYLIFEILELCPKKDLLTREQYYFDTIVDWKKDWNINKIAGSSLGMKRSDESKARMSKALKGRKCPQGVIDARSIALAQYDLNGNFIKKWKSAAEAGRTLQLEPINIYKCCKGKRYMVGDFQWRYYEDENNIKSHILKRKLVYQYDLHKEFIRTWRSSYDIERELGIYQQNIGYCCRGKRKTAGGFIWSYEPLTA